MNNKMIITGKEAAHLQKIENTQSLICPETYRHYLKLKERCQAEGFDLAIASAHRDFKRQLLIWNEKITGKRTLLDSQGRPLDLATESMSEKEKVIQILRWSALPGFSRHHWGTDIDIYDKASCTNGYQLQLTPDETKAEGIFGKLHIFLDLLISQNKAFSFYRPYEFDTGGVSPEKWHLSYSPKSKDYEKELNYEFFLSFLEIQEPSSYLSLNIIREYSEEIFERFINLKIKKREICSN